MASRPPARLVALDEIVKFQVRLGRREGWWLSMRSKSSKSASAALAEPTGQEDAAQKWIRLMLELGESAGSDEQDSPPERRRSNAKAKKDLKASGF